MAVTLIEKPDSRNFDSAVGAASGTWRYLARVTGEANPEAALLTAIQASATFFWYDLARKRIVCTPLTSELYTVDVEYTYEPAGSAFPSPTSSPGPTEGPGGGPPSSPPSGPTGSSDRIGPNESWEMGGRPPKIYTSLDVLYSEKAGGGLAPDNSGLLNVNRVSGEIDGLEIDDSDGVYTFSGTADSVTWGDIERWDEALWHTNLDTWRTMPPRSYCFMGYSLRTGQDGRWQVDFRFGRRRTQDIAANELRADAGLSLPTVATSKAGWDYLEIDYADVFDATAGLTVKKPTAMRIHQVLPMIDFNTLGIGG